LQFVKRWSIEDLELYAPYKLANCLLQLSLLDAEVQYKLLHAILAAAAFLLSLVIHEDCNCDVSWGLLIEDVSVVCDEDMEYVECQMRHCVEDLWTIWSGFVKTKTSNGTHPYFDVLWRKFICVRSAVLTH